MTATARMEKPASMAMVFFKFLWGCVYLFALDTDDLTNTGCFYIRANQSRFQFGIYKIPNPTRKSYLFDCHILPGWSGQHQGKSIIASSTPSVTN